MLAKLNYMADVVDTAVKAGYFSTLFTATKVGGFSINQSRRFPPNKEHRTQCLQHALSCRVQNSKYACGTLREQN